MYIAKRIVAAALIVAFASGVVLGNTQADMESVYGSPLPAAWKYDEWPAEHSQRYGFCFTKADYELLSEYAMDGDSTKAEIWWDHVQAQTGVKVERRITLTHDASAVSVVIQVFPSYRHAKLHFARSASATSKVSFHVWAPDFGVEIGDVALLEVGGAPPVEGWEGQTCRALTVIVGNVTLQVSGNSAVSAVALAAAMVEKLHLQEQQRQSGNHALEPTVLLSLESSEANYTQQKNPVHLPSSVTVSNVQGTESRAAFRARKKTLAGLGDVAAWLALAEPAANQHPHEVFTDPELFDNLGNPTTFETHPMDEAGQYLAGIVVWGANLVPAVSTAGYTVVK